MLVFVERKGMGRLGGDISAPVVLSRRSNQEKKPWKELPGIENRVESEFLHPVLLGESILPYRIWRPFEGVVPVAADGTVLDSQNALNRGFDGLSGWMRKAERLWDANKRSEDMTLAQLFDYFGQLSAQFPIAKLRVVYAASGSIPAASILFDSNAIIEHKLYWASLSSENEARYLAAILNSEEARSRAAAWQSRGQWGARDFDKVMFNLPIPRFDEADEIHMALVAASEEAEETAENTALPEGVKFQQARRIVREALKETGISGKIDNLVARLLGS
jgi:hypothetical protein